MDDAVQQYRTTRNQREDLFHVGRCAAHFAVDEQEAQFCTKLAGKASVFLPFNQGNGNDGAGNPPNPNGLKTDYLWEEILTPTGLTDIIENYAQKVGDTQIWPRYHPARGGTQRTRRRRHQWSRQALPHPALRPAAESRTPSPGCLDN